MLIHENMRMITNVDYQGGLFESGHPLDHDVPYVVFYERMRELD